MARPTAKGPVGAGNAMLIPCSIQSDNKSAVKAATGSIASSAETLKNRRARGLGGIAGCSGAQVGDTFCEELYIVEYFLVEYTRALRRRRFTGGVLGSFFPGREIGRAHV